MKEKRNNMSDWHIILAFAIMGLTVFELLILNAAFQTPKIFTPIWSTRGLTILYLISFSLLGSHLVFHRKELKGVFWWRHIMAFFMSLIIIYVFGILFGSSFICAVMDTNSSSEPIWSDVGAMISYWMAFTGWCSGYSYRKILVMN